MSRKEVRRDNPPALFLCPPLSSRRVCRRGGRAQSPPVNPYLTSMRSPGHPVLDAHRVIPHPDAGSRNTRLCHIALQCSTVSSRTPMRDPENTGKSTRKIHFSGPRITCGVTRCASRVGRRHPLSYRALTRYPENPGEGPRFCMVGDMFYLIL